MSSTPLPGVDFPIAAAAPKAPPGAPSQSGLGLLPRHRSLIALSVAVAALMLRPADAAAQRSGIDVSSLQGEVNWDTVASSGVSFAYVKATEGTVYQNPLFPKQYDGAAAAGLVRGAYHLALPDQSSGTEQADYFVDHGGGWAADDHTLPGALDLESDPLGDACYGLAPSELIGWLHDFADEYQVRTGRHVVLYTTADWWNRCTEAATEFGAQHPLWVADYGYNGITLPAGWDFYTFWQLTATGSVPGVAGQVAQNICSGDNARLLALANSTP